MYSPSAAELRRRIERALRELRQHVNVEMGEILSDVHQLEELEREASDVPANGYPAWGIDR